MQVVEDLLQEHRRSKGSIPAAIVMVGGTALAARGICGGSEDVDLFMSEVDDDIVEAVAARHRKAFGPRFKLDVTPANTIWGAFALADIGQAEPVRTLDVGGQSVPVRALDLPRLYAVKVAANRPKDMADLPAIAQATSYDAAVGRVNRMLAWFADRSASPDYAERFARAAARDFGVPLEKVDQDLALPTVTREKVAAIRTALEMQFTVMLRKTIGARPDLIVMDAGNPCRLGFEAEKSGAADGSRDVRRITRPPASLGRRRHGGFRTSDAALVLKAGGTIDDRIEVLHYMSV